MTSGEMVAIVRSSPVSPEPAAVHVIYREMFVMGGAGGGLRT